LAFSSLAPSSVDPLSPQRTFKMQGTMSSDTSVLEEQVLRTLQSLDSLTKKMSR
jgi:hypothetical protein